MSIPINLKKSRFSEVPVSQPLPQKFKQYTVEIKQYPVEPKQHTKKFKQCPEKLKHHTKKFKQCTVEIKQSPKKCKQYTLGNFSTTRTQTDLLDATSPFSETKTHRCYVSVEAKHIRMMFSLNQNAQVLCFSQTKSHTSCLLIEPNGISVVFSSLQIHL